MTTKTTTRRGAARPESSLQTGSLRTTCCAPITKSALKEKDAAKLATVFAALSDPVRLRLLSIVAAEGEICSCNLEGPLAKSQPTISHHTKVLAEAGLIVGEKSGRWMWWRAEPAALEALRQALGGS